MADGDARRPVVLFLCTGNSARSQMAEAFLKALAGHRFEVLSAGLEPTEVHPLTVRVMREAGIDITGQYAKGLGQFLGRVAVNVAVFVCARAEERCPTVWPWALGRLSWPFDDPAACAGTDDARLEMFRRVRDQIRAKIVAWLNEPPYAAAETGRPTPVG
jgi:arsenate reductase